MMYNDDFDARQVRKEGFTLLGIGAAWYVGILILAFAIGGVWWGISVATAPVVGKGEQYKQINSAENRTFQYQRFFDLDSTIRTQVRNADSARQELADFNKQTPQRGDEAFSVTETRNQLRANVTGNLQLCQSNVAQYNNDTQEWTRQQFVDNKLPDHFSPGVCDSSVPLPPAPSSQR